MTPVLVQEGDSPVVLAMPHGGQYVPEPIKARLNPLGQRLDDTDWWIDRLYDGLLESPTTVKATYSRYVIDANRAPSNESLYPGQNTTGLCSPVTFDGEPIYRPGQEPDADESAERAALYHAPYHAALAEQIERVKSNHGIAILYDCHSIRSRIPYLFEGELPVFNIGSNGGQTCHKLIERAVVDGCRTAPHYPYALNGRFKGGWTTRHYGNPDRGVHAVQMELGQRAYMDEQPPWAYRPDLADQVRPFLKTILSNIEKRAFDGQLIK